MAERLRLTEILTTSTAVANYLGEPVVAARHVRTALRMLEGETSLDDHGRRTGRRGPALRHVDELNGRRRVEGLPWTNIHLALHIGEVLYGNIGSRERLDFTVVGPAVNEVARIEAMCRSLDQRVVISSAFATAAGDARARLVSLGRYALRGVRRPEELFTIDPGAG